MASRYGLVTRHTLSSSEDSGVETRGAVPVEVTTTVSSATEVFNVSSDEELILTVDISSSSDVEMSDGRGPWLGA